jgi:HK97 family phage major capsid protein
MTIEELKARRCELLETAKAIQATADAEKRDMTADESAQLESVFAEGEKIKADIARRESLASFESEVTAANNESRGRQSVPAKPAKNEPEHDEGLQAREIRTPIRNAAERGRYGWHNFGDFAFAVRNASMPGGEQKMDPRLLNAPTTYGSEGIGPDGGFAVPPDFRSGIMTKVMGEDSLISRTDQIQTSSNGITVPKDETTPWGTAGIQGYWTGEGAAKTQSKPVLETSTIKVHKLAVLVPVTDELLDDAPALGSYVARKAGEVIDFKITDAIINGTGAGMPLGILNSPATVSQAAEGSQVADTIHGLNLVKMWARLPANWRQSAVWLAHPDVEALVMTAGIQVGPAAAGTATGGALVWMPPGGLSGSPFSTLFGRPIIPTQAAQQPGDVGDLILASMGQYASVIKGGGLKADTSIHLFFDYDVTAFRFVFRMGGQPWWSAPIAAKNGSTTYGPFVTLAAR